MIDRLALKAVRTVSGIVNVARGAPIGVWHRGQPNWGDDFAPVLIHHLGGRTPVHSDDVPALLRAPRFATVGSILHQIRHDRVVVWGSGFITDDPNDPMSMPRVRPERVLAVRGPLTRRRLEALGIPCPAVYGDPALLAPRWLDVERSRDHRLCIVPHVADRSNAKLGPLRSDAHIVDLAAGIEAVVADVCSCAMVASSSLHGLVLADAYRIPSVWISFGDRVLGGGFKFRDYFASIGQGPVTPLNVKDGMTSDDIGEKVTLADLDVDLDALFAAQPFGDQGHGSVGDGPTSFA